MMRTCFFLFSVIWLLPLALYAQAPDNSAAKSSAAYAEVLLRRTELAADVDALSADYTDTNPKIVDSRNEIAALDKWLVRILAVKPSESGKLTLSLGKLIIRRSTLESELEHLLRSYNDDHQDVKRVRKRLAVFDAAIGQLLK